MSSNMKFNILVGLDGREAAAGVDNIRREMAELSDKTIGLNISDAEAKAKLKELKVELEDIARSHPDISVRIAADKALAELALLKAAADDLNGKEIGLNVSDNGSANRAKGDVQGLMMAGLALGPAIIPVAGAVAAALAAIGIGAVGGLAAIGTVALGFSGVSKAVGELGTAQENNGAKAVQAASQQISSANSIANAQDTLRTAVSNVAVAQTSAAQSVHSALEQLTAAHQAVESAVRQEANAERSLANDQHAAQLAQQALTQARVDAQRALQDMSASVTDNALAQRRAQLDLEAAQAALLNISATDPRHAQAQLTVDEQQQRLLELQTQGQRLVSDKAAADAKGVEGSKAVTSAQDTLTASLQKVADGQQSVRDATLAVATAQQREVDATNAVSQAQAAGARSVEAAQQSVVSASRALQSAQASAAAQAAATAASQNKLTDAYDKLTPAGQQFAHFIHDDLEPKIKGLQVTAQNGLLPGVEQGLKNMLPMLPTVDRLVGTIAHDLGDMATRAGAAFNSPFWRGFFGFIQDEATPSILVFSHVMGNLATGGAAILMAFKPVWDQMGVGIDNWSKKFSDASKNLSSNPAFQNFLKFIHDEGPIVMNLLGSLITNFVRIGEALAPWGGAALGVLDATSRLINILPQGVLDWLAPTILGIVLGVKAWNATTVISNALMPIMTAEVWSLNAAWAANPIGIVIIALVALGFGIYEIVKHWRGLRTAAEESWNGIKWIVGVVWDWMRPVFDGIGLAVRKIGEAFGGVRDWVRDHWHEIADLAAAPIRFVVETIYDNGILPVWNGIASTFGMHTLAPVHFATGGVLPGYSPGRDSVPAMLSPGEGILIPEAVQGLGAGFVHWANRTFSAGRVTGGSGYADGGIVADVAGIFTDPLGTLRGLFAHVLGDATRTPGTGELTAALKKLPDTVIGAAVDKAKSLITSMASAGMGGFGGGAGVDRWSGVTLAALAMMGQPGSLLATTLRRMNQESGGNPTAVNRTDINWQHGTPSVGLMQVIGPTYASNRVIDHGPYLYGVSVDPISNITASMHYAIGRYGSLASAYNRAGGYADGGIVTSPQLAHVGESGAEAIVPLTRPGRARAVMNAAGLGGSTVNVGPVHLHRDVDVDTLAHRLAFASRTAGL